MISYLITKPDDADMSFVVNTAVDEIILTNPIPKILGINTTLGGWLASEFEPGENIVIEGIQITLPFQFTFGQMDNAVKLAVFDGPGGGATTIPLLPTYQLTTSNQYLEVGELVEYNLPQSPPPLPGNFNLLMNGINTSISMKNVPVDMNTKTYFVSVAVKVRHTLQIEF